MLLPCSLLSFFFLPFLLQFSSYLSSSTFSSLPRGNEPSSSLPSPMHLGRLCLLLLLRGLLLLWYSSGGRDPGSRGATLPAHDAGAIVEVVAGRAVPIGPELLVPLDTSRPVHCHCCSSSASSSTSPVVMAASAPSTASSPSSGAVGNEHRLPICRGERQVARRRGVAALTAHPPRCEVHLAATGAPPVTGTKLDRRRCSRPISRGRRYEEGLLRWGVQVMRMTSVLTCRLLVASVVRLLVLQLRVVLLLLRVVLLRQECPLLVLLMQLMWVVLMERPMMRDESCVGGMHRARYTPTRMMHYIIRPRCPALPAHHTRCKLVISTIRTSPIPRPRNKKD